MSNEPEAHNNQQTAGGIPPHLEKDWESSRFYDELFSSFIIHHSAFIILPSSFKNELAT